MPKVEFTVTQPVLDWVVAQTQEEPVNDATLLRLHAWKEGKAGRCSQKRANLPA